MGGTKSDSDSVRPLTSASLPEDRLGAECSPSSSWVAAASSLCRCLQKKHAVLPAQRPAGQPPRNAEADAAAARRPAMPPSVSSSRTASATVQCSANWERHQRSASRLPVMSRATVDKDCSQRESRSWARSMQLRSVSVPAGSGKCSHCFPASTGTFARTSGHTAIRGGGLAWEPCRSCHLSVTKSSLMSNMSPPAGTTSRMPRRERVLEGRPGRPPGTTPRRGNTAA
mmetsp:Transcript_138265/g.441833  ORF Transcript_138265/g.441833 Transcript_138265/m.441833 type:complete len:228 (+) Transcript_138265:1569-2252(+)